MNTYSLDPNRPTPYMVIDNFDEYGRYGVYSGSYDDCQAYIAEQGDSFCIGMYEIVPNPRYNK